jgi:hypothetical protein
VSYLLALPIVIESSRVYYELVNGYFHSFMPEEAADFWVTILMVPCALAGIAMLAYGIFGPFVMLFVKRDDLPTAVRWLSCRDK